MVEALEHLQKKEFRKAEKIAKEVVKTNPNNVDALRLLAIIANEAECHNDAEKLLKRVVKLKPLHMDAWHDLSGALKEQNKLPEAIEALESALKIAPDNAQTHYLLASSLALPPLQRRCRSSICW